MNKILLKLNLKSDLGQHLTVNKQVLKDVLEAADINKDNVVIEVGAGTGILTKPLCEKAKKVVAYEIDPQFKLYLDALLKRYGNLEIRFENIRKAKINFAFDKVVGTIPYHITEPLLWKFWLKFTKVMVFVVGKKFAYCLTQDFTKNKVDSEIPLIFQSRFKIELLKIYPKTYFRPTPPIDSALIRLTPIPKESFKNDFIRYIVRYLFDHKNSKLKNALREAFIDYSKVAKNKQLTKNQSRKIISEVNFPAEKMNHIVDGANILEEIEKLKRLEKMVHLTSS